jgi:flagellar basal-body rod protein FlgB
MIPGLFNDPTSKALRVALEGLQQRQQAIASNIANNDTPNYKAKEVKFEEMLAAELADPNPRAPKTMRLGLETTNDRHIPVKPITNARPEAKPVEVTSLDGSLRNDGNTVDVEREMSKLAETQILYTALGQITGTKLGVLRTAINEGRR